MSKHIDTGPRIHDTGHRAQDTGPRIHDTGLRTQDTGPFGRILIFKKFRLMTFILLVCYIGLGSWVMGPVSGCAKPLAEGKIYPMKPVSRIITADANTIYYGIKWAFEEMGYPLGSEDLRGGVIESKWIPVGAASHYVQVFKRKDYGATDGAYYKMTIKIIPGVEGGSEVVAKTEVNSLIVNVKTTGDKEREVLQKISEHARGYSITVTNLGVEE